MDGLGDGKGREKRTELPVAYFFSVPTTWPDRWAALRADFPLITVSRGAAPPRRTFLPILTSPVSKSAILNGVLGCFFLEGRVLEDGAVTARRFWLARLGESEV
jgi:hypothetical protein